MATLDDLLFSASVGSVADVITCLTQKQKGLEIDVNARCKRSGRTALSAASEYGSVDCVRELLARRAEPNMADDNCSAPLHYAAFRGNLEVIRELMRAKANPHAFDNSDEAALGSCVAGFLIAIEQEKKKRDGPAMSLSAQRSGLHAACCALLLDHRADPLQRVHRSHGGGSAIDLITGFDTAECHIGLRHEVDDLRKQLTTAAQPVFQNETEDLIVEVIKEEILDVLPEVCTQLARANVVLDRVRGEEHHRIPTYSEGPVPTVLSKKTEQPYRSYGRRLDIWKKVHNYEDAGVHKVSKLRQQLSERGK